ncbi:MAG: hypothetical protein GXO36_01920 [Chloroflexi bacterium]|nr:hypothetical protein [Chloroflexota bacterium]
MEPIPDTSFYFYLGYAVILGGMALYVLSLFYRWKKLRQAWEELDELSRLEEY